MIIIRLQLAVSNSVNVQVKRLEYFSRFWGYKRFVNHKTYRKTLFFSKQNGQKNTVIYQGWGAENKYQHIPRNFGVFPRRKSHGIFLYSLSGPYILDIKIVTFLWKNKYFSICCEQLENNILNICNKTTKFSLSSMKFIEILIGKCN